MKKKRSLGSLVLSVVLLAAFALTPYTAAHAEGDAPAVYTVARGDCLYSIARDVLGDGNRWRELYELNKAQIAEPSLIYAGQSLLMPEGSRTQSKAVAAELAANLLAKAETEEPAVTSLLKGREADGIRLVGLENRLKTADSLTRKILTDAQDKEVSLEEAAAGIGDVLRYTLCSEDGKYVKTVDATLKSLTQAGITVVIFNNTWGNGNSYKGINTKCQTADGFVFELQFHTPDSFEAKTVEHAQYEVIRSGKLTDEELAEAEKVSSEIYAAVPVPDGASAYAWKNE